MPTSFEYSNGYDTALAHRLDLEIAYLEHLIWMLEDSAATACKHTLKSITNRLVILKAEFKTLTEKKAV